MCPTMCTVHTNRIIILPQSYPPPQKYATVGCLREHQPRSHCSSRLLAGTRSQHRTAAEAERPSHVSSPWRHVFAVCEACTPLQIRLAISECNHNCATTDNTLHVLMLSWCGLSSHASINATNWEHEFHSAAEDPCKKTTRQRRQKKPHTYPTLRSS